MERLKVLALLCRVWGFAFRVWNPKYSLSLNPKARQSFGILGFRVLGFWGLGFWDFGV